MGINLTKQGVLSSTGEGVNPNFYTGNGIVKCGNGISTCINNGYVHHSEWTSSGTGRAQGLGFNGRTGPWTVSFDIKSSVDATITIDVCDKGYSKATYGTNLTKDTWMHKSFVITTATDKYNTSSAYNGFVDFNYSTAGTLDIINLKVEEGTKETPWIPSVNNANYISSTVPFIESSGEEVAFGNAWVRANDFYEI